MAPRAGHAIDLEEPAASNRGVSGCFSTAERDLWLLG